MAMSMAVPTLSSPNSTVLGLKKTASLSPLLAARFRRRAVPCISSPTELLPARHSPGGLSRRRLGILYGRNFTRIFAAEHGDGNGGVGDEEGEREYRGESTLPERFRYLTKEAPDPPLRWPWFVGTLISSTKILFSVCIPRKYDFLENFVFFFFLALWLLACEIL